MSIREMTRVWEKSAQSGSKLLLMLALADHADDDGFCWPGIETLAKKIRTKKNELGKHTTRNVTRLISQLEQDCEVFVNHRGPQGKSNQYLILIDKSEADIVKVLRKKFGFNDAEIKEALADISQRLKNKGGQIVRGDKLSGVTDESGGDDSMESGGGDSAESSEPSITAIETSTGNDSVILGLDDLVNQIMDYFIDVTRRSTPDGLVKTQEWLSECEEILTRCNNLTLAKEMIDFAVEVADDNEKFIILSPKSLYTTIDIELARRERRARRQKDDGWITDLEEMEIDPAPGEPEPDPTAVFWGNVLDQLSLQMTRATFDMWLKETRLIQRTETELIIQTKDGYAQDWLENRMYNTIHRTVADICGHSLELRFVPKDNGHGSLNGDSQKVATGLTDES